MAKPACTVCGQNEGMLMVTSLDDGDTQVICGPDLPGFALGMAAGLTEGMEPDEASRYGDAFYAIAAHSPMSDEPGSDYSQDDADELNAQLAADTVEPGHTILGELTGFELVSKADADTPE